MQQETAGDPMTDLKWTRRTTQKIADQLAGLRIRVSRNTVGRLLKQMDYSLRVNHKKLAGRSRPDRDAQFEYIGRLRKRFARASCPIVSVDTKKKELGCDQVRLVEREGESGTPEISFAVQRVRIPSGQS